MGYQSLYLDYGGDLVISPQGSLQLAIDDTNTATASLQLLQRIIFTNPLAKDTLGNVIARADSLQYSDFGAGIASLVNSQATANEIVALKASIADQMAQFPNFLTNPAPVITVTFSSLTLTVQVQFQADSGQLITTPAYLISSGS